LKDFQVKIGQLDKRIKIFLPLYKIKNKKNIYKKRIGKKTGFYPAREFLRKEDQKCGFSENQVVRRRNQETAP
jgi:hypothetical protein